MIRIKTKFIILVVLSSVYAIIGGGPFPYFLFFSMLTVLALAYIYILVINHMLEVRVVFKRDYYSVGDQSECITQVNCEGIIPIPYIEIISPSFINSDNNYIGEVSNITLEENKWITSNIVFIRRGIYDLGRVDLKVSDLFQIITLNKEIDVNIKIKVYPKIYDLNMVTIGDNDIYHESITRNSMNEDAFQIKDVRKYRHGDSLKKIHWKVSAKTGELYVKNSENISGEEIILFLDMAKANFMYEDKGILEENIIDLGVSIIRHIRTKDKDIRVFLNNSCPMAYSINTKDDENNLMELLIQKASDGEDTIEDYIYKNIYKIHRTSRIIIVTSGLPEEFIQSIIALKTRGYLLSAYYCEEEDKNKAKEDTLKRWGIDCKAFKTLVNQSRGNQYEVY